MKVASGWDERVATDIHQSEHICYEAGFRETFTMEAGLVMGPEL